MTQYRRHGLLLNSCADEGAENVGMENAGVEYTGAKTYGKPTEQIIKIRVN